MYNYDDFSRNYNEGYLDAINDFEEFGIAETMGKLNNKINAITDSDIYTKGLGIPKSLSKYKKDLAFAGDVLKNKGSRDLVLKNAKAQFGGESLNVIDESKHIFLSFVRYITTHTDLTPQNAKILAASAVAAGVGSIAALVAFLVRKGIKVIRGRHRGRR